MHFHQRALQSRACAFGRNSFNTTSHVATVLLSLTLLLLHLRNKHEKENLQGASKTGSGDINLDSESQNGSSSTQKSESDRGQWGSRVEFLLSSIGMSVGLGNIWRFPYLTYKNGGAVFLIPYFILLVLVGKPMYFLETAMGQFSSLSSLGVWRCCPIGKGIGWAQQTVCILVCIYYNVIVGYTIFYIASSFTSTLPWMECSTWWGADERCYIRSSNLTKPCLEMNGTEMMPIIHLDNGTCNSTITLQTAASQYWNKYVLHIHESDGLSNIGAVRWDLCLCLLLAWILVCLCLVKGIKTAGKVVYVTATFPYLILLVLLVRGLTLEGSGAGLRYLFIPQWDKLLEVEVWRAAAEQMFFSLGLSWGIMVMFGSYNDFRNKSHVDSLIISFVDFGTSLIGCVAIFSILGYLANQLGIDVAHVAAKGPGLAFEVYPEAISLLPLPQLWSVLFFVMLFTLGLDSQFAQLESVLSNIQDEWPKLRNYKTHLTVVACIICFLLGIPCITAGGQYVLNLFDTYGAGASVMLIAFFEMICFSWIYGVRRLMSDIEFMLGFHLSLFWFVTWGCICPVFLGVIFILSCIFYTPVTYDKYAYPTWGEGIGLGIMCISIIQIPIGAIWILLKYYRKGDIMGAFRPTEEWGPADAETKQQWEDDIAMNAGHNLKPRTSSLQGIDNIGMSHSTLSLAESEKRDLTHRSKF